MKLCSKFGLSSLFLSALNVLGGEVEWGSLFNFEATECYTQQDRKTWIKARTVDIVKVRLC